MEELGNAYGSDGIDAILGAVEKRFSESCQMKVAGSTDWWRVSKLAIFFSALTICIHVHFFFWLGMHARQCAWRPFPAEL